MSLRRLEPALSSTVKRLMFTPSGGSGGGGGGGGTQPSSLLAGLQAYYAFETLITDSTDNGNTLTNNGVVTQTTGIIGQAADFVAASSQFLSIAANIFNKFTASSFTIAAWVKPSVNDNGGIVTKDSDSTGRDYTLALVPSVVNPAASFYINGGGGSEIITGDSVIIGQWNLVVAWYVLGISVNIQVNNGLVATSLTASVRQDTAAQLQIGARQYSTSRIFMSGSIDEVYMGTQILSSGQRTSMWNGGAGVTYPFTGVP